MKSDPDPRRLDLSAAAEAAQALQGEVPLAELQRLAAEAVPGEALGGVQWQARPERRRRTGTAGELWLHLQADTLLPLRCQRCMGPVAQAVHVAQDFRFVADEQTAEREDDRSEEDVLVLEPRMDLLALLEDELLLALPLVPMHDTCPVPVKLAVADENFAAAEAEQPHPFAALQQLRQGK